ncbi:ParM/StbA family protein [Acidihalobacter ferrooxydans]|uniref:Uncharacterized protein n=1 Tax=Acidihalobacter ferrooxydans TaxID=1765967 RepID=A0A1P8UFM2_9GAMM|nr:ParM/StbA family protein [Acidihalobacter ferrooxydans]APZ42591.1 hypothetical protein BW247_05345 [Acidihalobacter ferrooxydans]
MYVIALDIGYGNNKRAIGHDADASPRLDQWPSVIAPERTRHLSVNGDAGSGRLVRFNNKGWLVGVDLEEPGAQDVLHEDYVGSDDWLIHLLAGLQGIPTGAQVLLVVGLPVDEWMLGAHNEKLRSACERGAKEAGINLKAIKIVPQPLGAFVDANARCDGLLVKRRVLVVDPGRYTLDWTLFVNGKLNSEGSGSDRRGAVSRIIEGVAREIQTGFGAKVGYGRIRKALEDDGVIVIRGQQVDCKNLIQGVSAQVVDEAMSRIRETLRVEDDVDRIVLAGGGARFYQPRLEETFGADLLDVAPRPVQANVRGYWLYGSHSV